MLKRLIIISSVSLLTSTPVIAQNYAATPFVGYRTSSTLENATTSEEIDINETSSFGILLSMKKDATTDYDFLFSRQNADLRQNGLTIPNSGVRFDYYHFGGTVNYKVDNLRPFVAGGLDATHISPADSAYSSETKFSLSIGGGLKVPFSQHMAARLELRGYGTIVDSSTSILCSGGCIATFTGSVFWQVEALAGLQLAF